MCACCPQLASWCVISTCTSEWESQVRDWHFKLLCTPTNTTNTTDNTSGLSHSLPKDTNSYLHLHYICIGLTIISVLCIACTQKEFVLYFLPFVYQWL